MKLVTLQPVEGTQKSVEIKVGRTIIGRGPLLECADKKVSRNHAIIEVRESGDIYLTPTHVNPCFYLPNDSNAGFEVLKKDCPQLIHNGDSFSLLPNSFRYRVSISDVSNYENIESEKSIAASAAAVAAAASTTAASKVKESSTGSNLTSGTGSKKDETLLNGDNKKDLKEETNHKASPVEESPKDNGKPTQPVKNGLSPVRASSRRNESKSSLDKDLTGPRDQQNKSQAPNKQNLSESHDLVKDTTPSASAKEKESKGRETRKTPVSDESRSDKKAATKETPNTTSSVANISKDKSPLASKKILSEKSAAKKDARKEKTDSEKQKQLKNFDFDDDDDEPVVKPTGKKPAQKAQAKKAAEKPASASPSVSVNPSTSKKKETPSRKRSPPPSQTSASGASGSRSTRTHRTLIQRISLDDFMASDEEWIATYASSDEERKKARKRLAKRKTAAEASSDEDDWSGKKAKKSPAKKSRKTNTDDDNEDSEDIEEEEEEVKPRRARGRPSTTPKRNKKKAKAVEVSESSEESKNEADSGDDEDDDNDGEKPKTPSKKSQATKKKETPKTASAAATSTPPKKKVFRRKKSLLYAESEEDFQRQLARAIRESKKEQLKKECEKREKATGYRPTDHAALSSTTAST